MVRVTRVWRAYALKLVGLVGLIGVSGAPAAAQVAPSPVDDLYTKMARAYAGYDVGLIRSVYAKDALTAEIISGFPAAIRRGEANIAWFAAMFADEKAKGHRISIAFRISNRSVLDKEIVDTGTYRFTINAPGQEARSSFGNFVVTARRDPKGAWAIVSDVSASGSVTDYEGIPRSALPEDGNWLSGEYAQTLVGDYVAPSGCRYRITRSAIRLVLQDDCHGQWRALNRVNGWLWNAGDTVISNGVPSAEVEFAMGGRAMLRIRQLRPGGLSTVSAERAAATYSAVPAAFASADGTQLAGTFYSPLRGSNNRAVVLVHGSGPQDRHGYASIIDIIGQVFLDNGYSVLAFDKRGTGGSGGVWSSASFAVLAQDALAGREWVARHLGRSAVIGLAGSSQAGWVAAKAIERNSSVPFVVLLGAAGAALTVPEQNNYYTANQMRCAGIPDATAARVVDQANLFYAAKANRAVASRLAILTRELASDRAITDYLMPGVVDPNPNAWYMALETDFDPLPIWKSYRGRALFTFGGMDDSTPGLIAADRVRGLGNRGITVAYHKDAQHLGLKASSTCAADLVHVSEKHANYWNAINAWLRPEKSVPAAASGVSTTSGQPAR